jgi:hypothetical protein
MTKTQSNKAQNTTLIVNMRKLTLSGLHHLISSKDNQVILKSGQKFAILQRQDPFDKSVLRGFEEYLFAHILTSSTPFDQRIGKNEAIFSAVDAEQILDTINAQQKQQQQKRAVVAKHQVAATPKKRKRDDHNAPLVTPPGTPPSTPPRTPPRTPPAPGAPKKPKPRVPGV